MPAYESHVVIEPAPTARRRVQRGSWACGTALIGLLLISAGCGRSDVDVPRALRVANITTGWFDAATEDLPRNRLVPTISFRLDNVSDQEIGTLRIQGAFRRVGEDVVWGSAFIRAIGREGLAPGESAGPFTLRSDLGYTGEQARREMFDHNEFVDVTVDLFVKHRSAQWVRLDRYQIDRNVVTE